MIELYFIIFVIILALGYIFFVRAAKGPKRSMSQLKRPIEDLLKRGFNGGTLIIDHAGSNKFVQFQKYIREKGDYGIRMDFPDASWSHSFVTPLKMYCDKKEIKTCTRSGVTEKELSFLEIDFGKDVDVSYAAVKHIFEEIIGLGGNEKYYILLENSAVDDVLVDSV